MVQEAARLRKAGIEDARIMLAAGSPVRAEEAAEALLASGGCDGLLSLGVCGGLHPDLRPGALIVHMPVTWPWLEAVVASLKGGAVQRGTITTRDHAVVSPDEKACLFQETGALGVDMETSGAALVADKHAVPFAALRVVVDAAHQSIPPAALAGFGADGESHVRPVLLKLASRPQDLPGLLRLGHTFQRALSTLEALARTLAAAERR
jgi:nucleoside phosphorylase